MQWFVKEGDQVKQFDRLCEVQSDKVSGSGHTHSIFLSPLTYSRPLPSRRRPSRLPAATMASSEPHTIRSAQWSRSVNIVDARTA
jgi:hypothetical protein